MLIRIVNKGNSPACTFEAGQLLKMETKRAQRLVDGGFAEVVEADPVETLMNRRKSAIRVTPSTHMMPPRYICGCGFVAKDPEGLRKHKEVC